MKRTSLLARGMSAVCWVAFLACCVWFAHSIASLPQPEPEDRRCIRSGGRWSEGTINGHHAGWCTWGPR